MARLPRGTDVAVVRDGTATIVALDPVERLRLDGGDALRALDALGSGWWAGWLSYDLGRSIERVPDLGRPAHTAHDLVLTRFETRIEIAPDGTMDVHGNERSAAA